MRQVGGDSGDLHPRPRKRSSTDLGSSVHASNTPTSFMLGNEQQLQARLDQEDAPKGGYFDSMDTDAGDSQYGVRSIDEGELAPSLSETHCTDKEDTSHTNRPATPRRRSTIRAANTLRDRSIGELSAVSGLTSEASSPRREKTAESTQEPFSTQVSLPQTPLSQASPSPHLGAQGSYRSVSVQSLRHPDEEYESGSQAIFSSSDEDSVAAAQLGVSEPSSTALQLVMPSLTLPSRRPFTEQGKQLGRLRILFAGAAGSGKTSLIKSFVQTCNQIVHIDSPATTEAETRRKTKSRTLPTSTRKITEIVASTKPYPEWWSELEESQILRRRKSSGKEVLDRNVCFIDTPGYDNGSSMLEGMESVLQYIETQMKLSITTSAMHDNDLLGVLGGSGGSQIDVVLYLLPAQPKPMDFEFMQQLSKLTNVIPLLAKIDLLQEEAKIQSRERIVDQIRAAGISSLTLPNELPTVFDVCSSPSNDLESMDASLLMASDFVQPLHTSDLSLLVKYLFDPTNAVFLKHVAAKKLVAWRKSPSTRSMALTPSPLRTNLFAPTMPLSTNPSLSGRCESSGIALSPTSAALTYTSARLRDHKQREERMAQINLGNWAEGLRRNLSAERARYESIANAEREKWLRERLQECVFDSKIVSTEKALACGGARASKLTDMCLGYTRAQKGALSGSHDALDPFKLMAWRRRALTALQVIGGFSVLMPLAWWVARTWELDWEWLDDYGLSRLHHLFGGFGPAPPPHVGVPMGRLAHNW